MPSFQEDGAVRNGIVRERRSRIRFRRVIPHLFFSDRGFFVPNDTLHWTFETAFPSSMEKAHELIEQTLGRLRRLGAWGDRELFAIQLALEESLINAVTHGNRSDHNKLVHFACLLTEDRVRFRIEDEGTGFKPDELPDPTDPAHIDVASGRGVLLIRSFMSHVEYNDRGNVIIMEKNRSADGAG